MMLDRVQYQSANRASGFRPVNMNNNAVGRIQEQASTGLPTA